MANRRRRLSPTTPHLGHPHAGHPHAKVEAIQEGTREPLAIAIEPGLGTPTRLTMIPEIATRTWIGRGDELDVGRESNRRTGPGHRHDPVLYRLTQRIECGRCELAELIEKEDSSVSSCS